MINLNKYKEIFNDSVNEYFSAIAGKIPEPLFSAMKYSLLSSGKRLRPSLVFVGAEFMNGDIEKVLPVALAMEFIHCYSLVHDDLPDMDNDSLRRGLPTTHIKYGAGMAILTGDALLNSAYEILFSACEKDSSLLKSAKIISELAGPQGMIAGQCDDISEKIKSKEDILVLYKNKTSALLKASLLSGALPFNPDENEKKSLSVFSDNIGMAFQIKDDLLEVEENTEVIGKSSESDENNNKNTLIKLIGTNKSKKLMMEFYDKSINAISCFGKRAEALTDFASIMINRIK